jgi:hypothetical protein
VKPKRKYTRKAKPEPEAALVEEESAPAEETPAIDEHVPMTEEEINAAVEEALAAMPPAEPVNILPEEDLQALLHAMVIRANASAADAAEKLAQVQEILLS